MIMWEISKESVVLYHCKQENIISAAIIVLVLLVTVSVSFNPLLR